MSSAQSVSTPGTLLRRNGRRASCEPCRKAKIRCDHQIPTCGQCVRLGKVTECFVHSAPMTTRNTTRGWSAHARSPNATTASIGRHDHFRLSSAVDERVQTDGYATADVQATSANTLIRETQVEQVTAIVLTLKEHAIFVRAAIEDYTRTASAALVPGRITVEILDSLLNTFSLSGIDGTERSQLRARKLAVDILNATGTHWSPTASTSVSAFVSAWTGSSIRLQALGLVCSVAGRSMLYDLPGCRNPQEDVIRTMLRLSGWCLAITREIAPGVTDM